MSVDGTTAGPASRCCTVVHSNRSNRKLGSAALSGVHLFAKTTRPTDVLLIVLQDRLFAREVSPQSRSASVVHRTHCRVSLDAGVGTPVRCRAEGVLMRWRNAGGYFTYCTGVAPPLLCSTSNKERMLALFISALTRLLLWD